MNKFIPRAPLLFRVFNDETGEIEHLSEIKPNEFYQYWEDNDYIFNRGLTSTLTQWTGLVDKNKKKLFEGDIISLHASEYIIVFSVTSGFIGEETNGDGINTSLSYLQDTIEYKFNFMDKK